MCHAPAATMSSASTKGSDTPPVGNAGSPASMPSAFIGVCIMSQHNAQPPDEPWVRRRRTCVSGRSAAAERSRPALSERAAGRIGPCGLCASDTLSDLLRGVRVDGAVPGRSRLSSPWALRFTEGAALTLVTLVRGRAAIMHGDVPPCS